MSSATNAVLTAQTRAESGKGVARGLRREGKVPAILYGKGQEPVSLTLDSNEVKLAYQKGRFRSKIVQLKLDGKEVKALPQDVQFHPVTDQIEHVDFIKVVAGNTIRVMIPVKFRNQERSIGLKRGGVLNVVRHEIEFECDPEHIPSSIEIDVLEMDIGSSKHINDIELPKGAKPVIKRNFTIATIAGRNAKSEDENAAAATAAAAPAAAAPAAKKEEKK